MGRTTCNGCPKRPACTQLCPDIESRVPTAFPVRQQGFVDTNLIEDAPMRPLSAIAHLAGRECLAAMRLIEHHFTIRELDVAEAVWGLDMTLAEAARRHGMSSSGVRHLMERVRRKLAKHYGEIRRANRLSAD